MDDLVSHASKKSNLKSTLKFAPLKRLNTLKRELDVDSEYSKKKVRFDIQRPNKWIKSDYLMTYLFARDIKL
jgi:hypothetical protein